MSTAPITPRPPHSAESPAAQRTRAQGPAPELPTTSSGDRIETRATPDPARKGALVSALLEHVPKADRSAARTAIPAILDAAHRVGNSDPNRIGYLLATAQTESDFGASMTETGHSRAWFDKAYGGIDGNRQGTDDGYAYRGRGYVQTTRAGRYAELSHHLGLPDVPAAASSIRAGRAMEPALVAHPERLEQPQLAAEALVVGVQQNLFTHNSAAALDRTIPTGRKPGDVDFYHARGIVNGIVKSQAQAIANHATTYAEVLDRYRHSVLGTPRSK